MVDLGQDADNLRIKVLEKEMNMDERKFTIRRIKLDIEKARVRQKELEQSIKQVESQIAQDVIDLASLNEALKTAMEGKTNG